MTQISASDVSRLRQQTGVGMMDCRKALVENDGNFDKAVEFLRKKGQKIAELRSGRDAREGVVITHCTNTEGALLRLSCETDFVAKNDGFVDFAKKLVTLAVHKRSLTVDQLKQQELEGMCVADRIVEQISKIGEKIEITALECIQAEGVVGYVHGDFRMGVLVGVNQAITDKNARQIKDVAMQIAAMNPSVVHQGEFSAEFIDKERQLLVEQVAADPKMAGKPKEMLDKIVQGKLDGALKEKILLRQSFVKDSSLSVEQYLKSVDPQLQVLRFCRVSL